MQTEFRNRTDSITRDFYWLLCDTWNMFFRGLVNLLFGIDFNMCDEDWMAGAEHRYTTKPGFFSFERHVKDEVNCEYWGFGKYLLVSRIRVHPKSA